jgi:hypothetical protein
MCGRSLGIHNGLFRMRRNGLAFGGGGCGRAPGLSRSPDGVLDENAVDRGSPVHPFLFCFGQDRGRRNELKYSTFLVERFVEFFAGIFPLFFHYYIGLSRKKSSHR